MQLQRPERRARVRVRDERGGLTTPPESHCVGWAGEPTIWRREGNYGFGVYMFRPGHSHYVGEIIEISGTDYIYVLKERTEDGWWKMEWPD